MAFRSIIHLTKCFRWVHWDDKIYNNSHQSVVHMGASASASQSSTSLFYVFMVVHNIKSKRELATPHIHTQTVTHSLTSSSEETNWTKFFGIAFISDFDEFHNTLPSHNGMSIKDMAISFDAISDFSILISDFGNANPWACKHKIWRKPSTAHNRSQLTNPIRQLCNIEFCPGGWMISYFSQ